MSHRVIFPLAAGALFAVGCAPKASEPTMNPPPQTPADAPEAPEAPEAPADPQLPPAPDRAPPPPINMNPPSPGLDRDLHPRPAPPLPTWDAVSSGHPAGATNPPIPVLTVSPEGDCYKDWKTPFDAHAAGGPSVRSDCGQTQSCGTAVICPPEAAQVLADWKAGKKGR